MAAELSKNNSQITTLNECADSVSVSHHGPSSMHQAVVLFLGRDTSYISVCSGSLYGRPPPPAVQVNCQHDLWRRELSLDGLLNLPRDELVPSAHVTVVCFLHWPIFIHAQQIKSAMFLFCFFDKAIFFPPSLLPFFPPSLTCLTITGDVRLTARSELHGTVSSSEALI